MADFESTVNKMLNNVEYKDVNKEDGLNIRIEDGNLSRIDNVYLILYATNNDVDNSREFIGHIIKKFLENNDRKYLKKFLRELLNKPTRLHDNSYMHYFSINLVDSPNKVELLEDLIKLGGDIALDEIGKVERIKNNEIISEIKERLKRVVINNEIKKKYNEQQLIKAVGESPIGKLPDELERILLREIGINHDIIGVSPIGGRKKNKKKKSLKKKRKTKRRKSLKKKQRKTKRKSRR
jgi:hypothetical protein